MKKLEGPLIIASNHGAWFDGWLIGAIFPPKAKVFPIRYATWYRYYYFPLFFPFLWAFGAFPVRKGEGLEKVLQPAIEILKSGGVVGIFPEGKRQYVGRPRNPRRGVAYLAVKTGAPILPVKITGNRGLGIISSLLRKRKIKVFVGEPFTVSQREIKNLNDYNKIAREIMAKIELL